MNEWDEMDYDGRDATDNFDQKLHYSHYSDKYYDQPRTIYGHKVNLPNFGYDYSDRIQQWDYKKAEQAAEFADFQGWTARTANWYQAYLQFYFNDPDLKLYHIMAGTNRSNGYEYLIFGYTHTTKEK